MIKDKTIAFIGAGFMGEALIRGLVSSKSVSPNRVIASDARQEALKQVAARHKIKAASGNGEAAREADIVVLAVKPQQLEAVTAGLEGALGREKLVVSIAAGVNTQTLERLLPDGARIIRAMPNMGAMVGQSATAVCAGGAADENDVATARRIFDAVGKSVVVDEGLMDAVTGLSGSGPAFVFMFLEALIDAGVKCGLARDVAAELAGQTLFGAATLARETGEHPARLKDRITSPGGTTIAGVASLEKDKFRSAVIGAVEAAAARSKELGS